MEPFRPLIDAKLIRAYGLKQIKIEDFEIIDNKCKIKDYKLLAPYLNLFCETIVVNSEQMANYINQFQNKILNEDSNKNKNIN